MPYVRRDATGTVLSLHRQAEDGAHELLPDHHPEVRAFLNQPDADQVHFARLDADFVRVLEDVIDTLIGKHLINITDLPAEAQAKLFSRKGFRERRSLQSLSLFSETDMQQMLPPTGTQDTTGT